MLLILLSSITCLMAAGIPPPQTPPNNMIKTFRPLGVPPWSTKWYRTHLQGVPGPRFNVADYTDPKTGLNPFLDVSEGKVPPRPPFDQFVLDYQRSDNDLLASYRPHKSAPEKRIFWKRNETDQDISSRRNARHNAGKFTAHQSPVEDESRSRTVRRFFNPNVRQSSGLFSLLTPRMIVPQGADKSTEKPKLMKDLVIDGIASSQSTGKPIWTSEPTGHKAKSEKHQESNYITKTAEKDGTVKTTAERELAINNFNETDPRTKEMYPENTRDHAITYSITLATVACLFFATLMGICVWTKKVSSRLKPKQKTKQRVIICKNANHGPKFTKQLTVSIC